MRRTAGFALLVVFLLLARDAAAQEPVATASSHSVVVGGEPGVVVTVNGVDVATALTVGDALPIDLGQKVNVSVSIAPPPEQTWEISGVRLGLVMSGPGSAAPGGASRVVEGRSFIPPGFTVYLNRTVDLSAMRSLGVGVFLMEFATLDANGSELDVKTFYVHVVGNPLFTVAGAVVTVASVATGYGLWRLFQDLRELRDTYERHRKEQERREKEGRNGVVKTVRGVLKDRDRLERRGLIRWAATGTGLGAVVLSWLQFLGYVAFDTTGLVLTALETGGLFLGAALLVAALHRRLPRSVRVPVQGPPPQEAQAEAAGAEPLAPDAGVRR